MSDFHSVLLKTYGRKKGKTLSWRKKQILADVLESHRLFLPDGSDISPLFFFEQKNSSPVSSNSRVIFEIGFGNGGHLMERAKRHETDFFIGCEPYENGVASASVLITENSIKNVLIYPGDSREVLAKLQDDSIDEFYVMFPDPWPKKKHIKRRLMSVDFLECLAGKLKKHGVINFASDQVHYVDFVLDNVEEYNELYGNRMLHIYYKRSESNGIDRLAAFEQKPCCWCCTKYEQKALARGEKCYYVRIFKNFGEKNVK